MSRKRRVLSDLANSCEYLTIEKLCSAVLESEKAKANRQLRCQNEETISCCYICYSRRECAISCKFLGNIENQHASIEIEKPVVQSTVNLDTKPEVAQPGKAPVVCCSLCNVEMSQAKTKFRIDGWEGPQPNENSGACVEELPVWIYLCPSCGKIEFKADERASK